MKAGPHPHRLVPAPIKGWPCPCCITHGALLGPVCVYPCATDYFLCVFLCLGQKPGSAAGHRSPGFIAAGGGRLCALRGVAAGHGAGRGGVGGQRGQPGSVLCGACSSGAGREGSPEPRMTLVPEEQWLWSPSCTPTGEGSGITTRCGAEGLII